MNRFILILLAFASTAFGQYSARKSPISIAEFGVSPSASAAANRAGLKKALNGTDYAIFIPSGTYIVDNETATGEESHTGAIYCFAFTGSITADPGVRVLFTNNTNSGFWFYNCHGMRVTGLRVGMQAATTARNSPHEIIKVDHSDYVTFKDTRIEDSAAAALLFFTCDRPSAYNTQIDSCQADGLHFANCRDFVAIGGVIKGSGDDALVCVNYADQTDWNGGVMSGFHIYNTARYAARNNGTSGVTWSDIYVDTSVKSGFTAFFDEAAVDGYITRRPFNVVLANSVFKNCGTLAGADGSGIYLLGVGSAKVSNCRIENAYSWGVHTAATTAGSPTPCAEATFENITVDTVQAAAGMAYRLDGVTKLAANGLHAKTCNSYGLYATGCTNFTFSDVLLHNVNIGLQAAATGGALRAEGSTYLFGHGLFIIDDQATATGYNVSQFHSSGASGTKGSITDIEVQLVNGTFTTTSNSTSTFNFGASHIGGAMGFLSSFRVPAANHIGWEGLSRMRNGTADGDIQIGNQVNSDFGYLQFGGQTSSFPSLHRSSAVLEAAFADKSGVSDFRARTHLVPSTLTTAGTTGNVTINKGAGSVRIAAAGTSVVVTNSLVTTSSVITACVSTNDTTSYVKNIVPASGSFTITLGAAATAETEIRWVVTNP